MDAEWCARRTKHEWQHDILKFDCSKERLLLQHLTKSVEANKVARKEVASRKLSGQEYAGVSKSTNSRGVCQIQIHEAASTTQANVVMPDACSLCAWNYCTTRTRISKIQLIRSRSEARSETCRSTCNPQVTSGGRTCYSSCNDSIDENLVRNVTSDLRGLQGFTA
jgi:hypothetical protein